MLFVEQVAVSVVIVDVAEFAVELVAELVVALTAESVVVVKMAEFVVELFVVLAFELAAKHSAMQLAAEQLA